MLTHFLVILAGVFRRVFRTGRLRLVASLRDRGALDRVFRLTMQVFLHFRLFIRF